MNSMNYVSTMNQIKATESFKKNTIEKMRKEAVCAKEKMLDTVPEKNATHPRRAFFAIPAFAFLVVCVAAVILFNTNTQLPKLTISQEQTEGMGFEGEMAYDIEELYNSNPWTEDVVLETMPVFENRSIVNEESRPVYAISTKEATEIAKRAAEQIRLTEYTIRSEEELIARNAILSEKEKEAGKEADQGRNPFDPIIIGADGNAEIQVDDYGNVTIEFVKGLELPKEYKLDDEKSGEEEYPKISDYLLTEYKDFIDMKSPQEWGSGGGYPYSGIREPTAGFGATFYEGEGDLTDRILAYCFNQVSFSSNEEGKLWLIQREREDLSHKVGDYPIITSAQAKEKLLVGQYITTVPEKLPGEQYVKNVELIYRRGYYEKYIMPYYKFLVEMPTMELENGLKTFGSFYVPAVSEEYLTEMPIWDGNLG